MAIRIPGNPGRNVVDIKAKNGDLTKAITRAVEKTPQRVISIWEKLATTFLDATGAAFLDAEGVPFQGKKEV